MSWPKLDKLYRYDPTFKHDDGRRGKSVPADIEEQGAAWSVTMRLPEKRGKALYNKCKEHFAASKPGEDFADVWGYKEVQGDELQFLFTVKRNGKTSKGKLNQAPLVLDANGDPLEDPAIYSGSTGDVYFKIFPSYNPSERKEGISLLLDKVVVTNPLYGGDDYDDIDDGAPGSAPASKSDDYDDEIPF